MTPQTMPIMTPKTPSTVSMPMQVANTPAPVFAYELASGAAERTEDIEYSFEEKRLAVLLKA